MTTDVSSWKGLVRRIPFSRNEDRADTIYEVNGLHTAFCEVAQVSTTINVNEKMTLI